MQTSGYISRVDNPYNKKFYGNIEKVTSAFVYVLKKQGWAIDGEADPAIYERDDRYENNGYQNLLIITGNKNKYLHLKSARLNVFIHAMDNTCDVEIRYEAQTHLVKQFSSGRNDQVVQGILDAVQEEIGR